MINYKKIAKKICVLGCATTLVLTAACTTNDNSNSINNSNSVVSNSGASDSSVSGSGVSGNQNGQSAFDASKIKLNFSDKYPEDYKNEITNKIKTVETNSNNESVSYIFLTDLHMDVSEEATEAAYRQLYAAVEIANNSNLDFICIGGDITDGRHAEENGKQNVLNILESVDKILENSTKPVFILKGNHDDNSFSAQIDDSLLYDANYIINSTEWYNATMAHFKQYATEYEDGYYYYDLPGKNTRVVCLNMSNSSDTVVDGKREEMGMYYYGYKDAQIKWLKDKAFSNPNMKYIILDHDGIEEIGTQYGEGSNKDNIKNAITEQNINHRVLVFNCGHFHIMKQFIEKSMGNLPYIRTECAKFFPDEANWSTRFTMLQGYTLHENTRVFNTVSEAAFDVVVVDKVSDKVIVDRFGSGTGSTLIPE